MLVDSCAHLFIIHSSALISARGILRLRSCAIRARPSRGRGRESRRECSLINKERRRRKGEKESREKRRRRRRRCRGARARPLRSAQRQARAECAQRAYFHQFRVSRGTARSYFIDDLSARRRARKKGEREGNARKTLVCCIYFGNEIP